MRINKLIYLVVILVSVFLLPGHPFGQYAIQNSVFGNGGVVITDSIDFTINGTIALPLIGKSGDENFSIPTGFWSQLPYFFTGIDNPFLADIPGTFVLYQNYPNPFNPITTIKFGLPKTFWVSVELYNILGQKVAILFDGEKQPGYYLLKFDGSHLASGMYLYAIRADHFYRVKKMMLYK